MPFLPNKQLLANRLLLPSGIKAILWDMDGVLIDSLGLDIKVCNQLIGDLFGESVHIPDEFIRSIFALHPPAFWQRIFDYLRENHQVHCDSAVQDKMLQTYETLRLEATFDLLLGIQEILEDAHSLNIKMAVVSNNLTRDVLTILQHAGIGNTFDLVVGNDIKGFQKKPAPDCYRYAIEQLGVAATECLVVEDSLLGLEAGFRAGCHTVGVTTGGTRFDTLTECGMANHVYTAFTPLELSIFPGDIRKKRIITPNDFISHMVEHIAWRLGLEIHLEWNNDQWGELGWMLGLRLAAIPRHAERAAALGMIDDGSAEILIDLTTDHPGATLLPSGVDLEWFLNLRCEQAASGRPMWELMTGIAQGLGGYIEVRLCGAEDPHHAWEGIFRTLGIALQRMLVLVPPTPKSQIQFILPTTGRFTLEETSATRCKAIRATAESELLVTVDFSGQFGHHFTFDVAESIRVGSLPNLLESLADAAGFSLQVECHALALSSSHVVLEDTGLLLGRVLLEILKVRMEETGVNGAGSSIRHPEDLERFPLRVGLSVEGRKFLSLIPLNDSQETLRKRFLVGHDVLHGIRSEDLDDFLDGLVGGLSASLVIHFQTIPSPESGWPMIFNHLGLALQETFAINPLRKGMPPGVKATLL
ncbi:MAG: HAD-IA family hydrolase [Magnetococcales bacterium]|nr:HAD-IA family hydrolase [Magnetococcales bacterium]MBF0437876.1 HAD-IA family hydrolase [Magnetococcales bacterium]